MSVRDPDGIIRYLPAGLDDPDRQMALRITNFLAGMEGRRAVAIYSLAMSMSLRGFDEGFQRAALLGISEACLASWEAARREPEPPPCEVCRGAGTVGTRRTLEGRFAPEDQLTCPRCKGTGHG